MRVAICISGQMRCLDEVTHVKSLIEKLSADVFISTWSDVGRTSAYDKFFPASSVASLLIGKDEDGKFKYDETTFASNYPNLMAAFYPHQVVTASLLSDIFKGLKKQKIEKIHEDFESALNLHGVNFPAHLLDHMSRRYIYSLPMYYKIFDCNQLKKQFEEECGFKYDVVLRVRMDTEFLDIEEVVDRINSYNEEEGIVFPLLNNITSKKENYFLHDNFAFGSSELMDKYSSVFELLSSYWDLDQYADFPVAKRAAEGMMSYHIRNKMQLKISTLKSSVRVKVQKLSMSYEEFLDAYIVDLKSRSYYFLQREEVSAYAILLGLCYSSLISGVKAREENKSWEVLEQLIEKYCIQPTILKGSVTVDVLERYTEFNWLLGIYHNSVEQYELAEKFLRSAQEPLWRYEPRVVLALANLMDRQNVSPQKIIETLIPVVLTYSDPFVYRLTGMSFMKMSKGKRQRQRAFFLRAARLFLTESILYSPNIPWSAKHLESVNIELKSMGLGD